MDIKTLIARARAILTSPKTEWPVIATRPETTVGLYQDYILVMAAIPAIMGFLKGSLLGHFGGMIRIDLATGLATLVMGYVVSLVLIYVLALIIDALAPRFGGEKNQIQALKAVAYAYTAYAVASIGLILPVVGGLILLLGAVYTLYLLYLGLPVLMKAPAERAGAYTGFVVVLAIVIGFVSFQIFGRVFGLYGPMGGQHKTSGVTVAPDSPLGKVEEWAAKVEAASKDLEAAQKSGNEEAQADAMGKMMGTVMGSGDQPVESLAPEKIKPFAPETLVGLARTSVSAERTSAMGLQMSEARATYSDDMANTINLEIMDMGGMKGVMGLVRWAAVEQVKETDNGYERTYKQRGRMIHEAWDHQSRSGQYAVIVAERFSVKVSGMAESIDVLKEAVQSIDLAGLEALKGEGAAEAATVPR